MRLLVLLAAVSFVTASAQNSARSSDQTIPSWARSATEAEKPTGTGIAPSLPQFGGEAQQLPPNPPPVPLDGGLTLLALAGAGLAARKLRASR